MPLANYQVLAGPVTDLAIDADSSPHVEVRIETEGLPHRIAVNVQSNSGSAPLLYRRIDDFDHPVLAGLAALPLGYTDLRTPQTRALALDYVRGTQGRLLLARDDMRAVPFQASGPRNDLREFLMELLESARDTQGALVYAFGERFPLAGEENDPRNTAPDPYFGFRPQRGIHDIHMNQGNPEPRYRGDNGVAQDGALFVRMGGRWTAIFLAFQTQSWETDSSGNPLASRPDPRQPVQRQPNHDAPVQIIAALVNAAGREEGNETVTVFNRGDAAVVLDGWSIGDDDGRRAPIAGSLPAGESLRFRLPDAPDAPRLANRGGEILLIDDAGTTVHSVAYTTADLGPEGWSVLF
ncbi:MAG: DUF2278 family protein [Rhodospirillales bacterium]|nr:DUF2278 family protein [Rhodospirillales bacterium]